MNQSISPNAQSEWPSASQKLNIPEAASEGFKVAADDAPATTLSGRILKVSKRVIGNRLVLSKTTQY